MARLPSRASTYQNTHTHSPTYTDHNVAAKGLYLGIRDGGRADRGRRRGAGEEERAGAEREYCYGIWESWSWDCARAGTEQ